MFKPVHPLAFVSLTAFALGATVPGSTAAQYFPANGPQCFRASSVSRFMPGPAGFVMVRTEGNRWFQLQLSPGCPDFRLIMQIGIRPNDSLWMCEGKAQKLGGMPLENSGQCVVTDIRPLPAGAAPGTI
jgi:hypothetical protein